MNIALIAHDAKKEMMIQLCIAYKKILSNHNLYATAKTGKLVSDATGLEVIKFLSGDQGGDQQIGARIAYGDTKYFLIPIGAIMGYFVVSAEPAVHTLKKQVEEITAGVSRQG